jgi:hypothetical protein
LDKLYFCSSPFEGREKKIGYSAVAECVVSATPNRILREQELFIEPCKAWNIIIKWGFSAQRALAYPRESGEKNLKNVKCMDWLPILDEIRTFFKENPDSEF